MKIYLQALQVVCLSPGNPQVFSGAAYRRIYPIKEIVAACCRAPQPRTKTAAICRSKKD